MNIDQSLRQAQAGNRNASTRLFELFQPLLKKAARQQHLRALADEAFAQASLSFIEAIHGYDENSPVPFAGYAKAKVYGDLRTLFRRERRNWQRETSANASSSDGLELVDTFADPAAVNEEQSTRTLDLQSALKNLPAQQRETIDHLFFHGETQAQAAARLGISQQAIAARRKKALQKLHEDLRTASDTTKEISRYCNRNNK